MGLFDSEFCSNGECYYCQKHKKIKLHTVELHRVTGKKQVDPGMLRYSANVKAMWETSYEKDSVTIPICKTCSFIRGAVPWLCFCPMSLIYMLTLILGLQDHLSGKTLGWTVFLGTLALTVLTFYVVCLIYAKLDRDLFMRISSIKEHPQLKIKYKQGYLPGGEPKR